MNDMESLPYADTAPGRRDVADNTEINTCPMESTLLEERGHESGLRINRPWEVEMLVWIWEMGK